jgi:hypothetical protein
MVMKRFKRFDLEFYIWRGVDTPRLVRGDYFLELKEWL